MLVPIPCRKSRQEYCDNLLAEDLLAMMRLLDKSPGSRAGTWPQTVLNKYERLMFWVRRQHFFCPTYHSNQNPSFTLFLRPKENP